MNILTSRQYLVDIMVKTLQIQGQIQPDNNNKNIISKDNNNINPLSKLTCQLHYGDNLVKYQQRPIVNSKGIADFKKQRITVPYTNDTDIALVFKLYKNARQEIFLGHFPIQVEKLLEEGKVFIENSRAKLQQTHSYINYQCKIIDKNKLVQSETDQISQQEQQQHKSRYSHMEYLRTPTAAYLNKAGSEFQFSNKTQKAIRHKRFSQKFALQTPFIDLPQQFGNKLIDVQEIITKKRFQMSSLQRFNSFSRDNRGQLRSQKLQKLQQVIKQLKKDKQMNNLLIFALFGVGAFFMGLILSEG